jgi:hypothetical protein
MPTVRVFNPSLLRSSFVDHIRGIDTFVDQLGGNSDNVIEYIDENNGDLVRTLDSLKAPKVLVYLEGISAETFPGLIRAGISIAVRAGDPFTILEKLLNGTSTASGSDSQQLLSSVIVPRVSPARFLGMERRFVYIADHRVFDYWEIRLQFTDKG